MGFPRSLSLAPCPLRQRGWVMLAVLFAVALLGVGMASMGTVWTTVAKRDKEAQLLHVGQQFARAIESYYRRSPGAEKQYPKSLQDLLLDPRFPMQVRHLRRIYTDPVTGGREWGLVRDERGGIKAVHSLSEGPTIKVAGFPTGYEAFAEATTYRDWVFKARVEEGASPGGSTFVQGPEQDDPSSVKGTGTGGSGQSGGGQVPPIPANDPVKNRQMLSACEEARQQEVNACEALRQGGDNVAWTECTQEASTRFQQCLSQRYQPAP